MSLLALTGLPVKLGPVKVWCIKIRSGCFRNLVGGTLIEKSVGGSLLFIPEIWGWYVHEKKIINLPPPRLGFLLVPSRGAWESKTELTPTPGNGSRSATVNGRQDLVIHSVLPRLAYPVNFRLPCAFISCITCTSSVSADRFACANGSTAAEPPPRCPSATPLRCPSRTAAACLPA